MSICHRLPIFYLQNKCIQQGKEPAFSPSVDKFKRKSTRSTKHLQSATEEKVNASSNVSQINLSHTELDNVNKPTNSAHLPPVTTKFLDTNDSLSQSSNSEGQTTQSDEFQSFPQFCQHDKWDDFFTPEVVCQNLFI